jgi:hypothetical protein
MGPELGPLSLALPPLRGPLRGGGDRMGEGAEPRAPSCPLAPRQRVRERGPNSFWRTGPRELATAIFGGGILDRKWGPSPFALVCIGDVARCRSHVPAPLSLRAAKPRYARLNSGR